MSKVVRRTAEGGPAAARPARGYRAVLHPPTATAVPRSVNRRAQGASRALQDAVSRLTLFAV